MSLSSGLWAIDDLLRWEKKQLSMADKTKQIEYTRMETQSITNAVPDSDNYGEVKTREEHPEEVSKNDSSDLYLNSHRDWQVKEGKNWGYYHAPDSYQTKDESEAIEMLVDAIEDLCDQVAEKYKESGWWKQIVRDGEDVTDQKTYGVEGMAGLGKGNISDTVRMMGLPKKATVYTVGTNKIRIEAKFKEGHSRNTDSEVAVFQHMTANEVKRYNKNV